MSLLFIAVVFVDAELSVFLLPSFMLVVGPDRVAQLFIRARDLTDFIARTAREPVLVSFVGGGARRSVVEDERGLDTE